MSGLDLTLDPERQLRHFEVINGAAGSISADGTHVAIVSGEKRVSIVRLFQTPKELVEYARRTVPRELPPCERRSFFLPEVPANGTCPG